MDRKSIDELTRLALAEPDDHLIRRCFAACQNREMPEDLSDKTRRWIVINLKENPKWQEKWSHLETEAGRKVDWQFLRPASGKARPSLKRRLLPDFPVSLPRPIGLRLAVAFAALALVLYGFLWVGSRLALPETHALASLSAYQDVLDDTVRGDSETDDFSAGIAALSSAQSDWLGLFPHYDSEKVELGIAYLTREFDATTDPFRKAEIAFFLGKAYLMKQDIANARHWLQRVLQQNVADYREEARRLLAAIQNSK